MSLSIGVKAVPPTRALRPVLADTGMKRLADRQRDSGFTSDVLNGLLTLCASGLKQRLAEALSECEKQLVRLADKATVHQQNEYFDSLSLLKEHRDDVSPRFWRSLENSLARLGQDTVATGRAAGASVSLSLADSVHLDESLVLADIATRVERRLREPLFTLGHRLGALCARTRIPVEVMPLGPRCITEALRYATTVLDLPQDHRLVLYRCFERVVMSLIGTLYAALNDFLVEKNVLPTLHVLPTDQVAVTPVVSALRVEPRAGDGFGALKLLLAQCRRAEEYTVSAADLQSALDSVQRQQRAADEAPRAIHSGAGIQQKILAVLQEHSVDGRVPRIDNDDADAIDLVAMLFEFLSFRATSNGLASWIMGAVQFPIVRAALDDKRFFLDRTHPARQLLNDLVEAVRFWVDEADAEKDPALMDHFKAIATRVASEYQGDAAVFLTAQQELSRLLESLSRKMDAAERRHVEAANGSEKLEVATLVARQTLAQGFAARKPNEFLRSFLERVWVDVISLGLLREAEGDPRHARRMRVVDQLLALGEGHGLAPADHAELQAELETGLNLIGLHAQDVQAIVHKLLSIAPQESDPISQTELALKFKGKARFGSEQKSAAAQNADASVPGELTPEVKAAFERLPALPVGTWFEFKTATDGEVVRRKLSWCSTRTGRCLLMSQRRTPSEHTFMQLARDMAEGRMRVVSGEHVALIDRALSDIGDTLRNFSAPKPGSRPVAAAPTQPQPAAPSAPAGLADGEKKTEKQRTLLLVDDEENILRALKRVLRGGDYRILTANGAAAARALLDLHEVQVIVSDHRMPDVTGTEFLSSVKAMYPDTVRILLSGYSDAATVTDAINRGAIYKFLTKPWDDEDLREQIREAFVAAETS